MSEPLFERYKDALRRGHEATLRGRTEEALAAYTEASALASHRPLPHASRGAVLARAGRSAEALAAFDAALAVAPRDEASLAGRAETLAWMGRRIAAADAYDRLADVQEAAGRLAEACATAGRALEQAESKERRRQVEGLLGRLRGSSGGSDADAAVARAVRVLGGVAAAHPPDRAAEAEDAVAPVIGSDPLPLAPEDAGPADDATIAAATLRLDGRATAAGAALESAALASEVSVAAAPESAVSMAAGRPFLDAARVHVAAGHYAAALDLCHQALAVVPADPSLHLELAEIYLARGWSGLAADKLALLGRLLDLDVDPAARARLCQVVEAWFPDDPRLTALCA
ncbi:MAG: tetratricopeptide repeat protein [Chloroflexi bacterium]|nr:tetratricopeptide repeat protein [Chloroflexota bacterium]